MEQRRLGATGMWVSRLALGTMTWGRDTDEDDASSQVKAFVDAGGTMIDTADVYVDGESERVVGRLLQGVVRREDVIVATKAVSRRGQQRESSASASCRGPRSVVACSPGSTAPGRRLTRAVRHRTISVSSRPTSMTGRRASSARS